MTAVDWTKIKYLPKEEWKDDPDKALPDLVYLLEEVRADSGSPLVIHVCYEQGGHVADSSHYATATEYATGVDFHLVGLPLLDQWLFVERYPFNGVGLYRYWNSPGLHVDLRRLGRDHSHMGKRWYRDRDGSYKALDKAFIKLLIADAEAADAKTRS